MQSVAQCRRITKWTKSTNLHKNKTCRMTVDNGMSNMFTVRQVKKAKKTTLLEVHVT